MATIIETPSRTSAHFITSKARLIGECEGCGRIGEVEEYSPGLSPLPGQTVFCGACTATHQEAVCFW